MAAGPDADDAGAVGPASVQIATASVQNANPLRSSGVIAPGNEDPRDAVQNACPASSSPGAAGRRGRAPPAPYCRLCAARRRGVKGVRVRSSPGGDVELADRRDAACGSGRAEEVAAHRAPGSCPTDIKVRGDLDPRYSVTDTRIHGQTTPDFTVTVTATAAADVLPDGPCSGRGQQPVEVPDRRTRSTTNK